MNYKTIELQILQLEESFSKSRSNIYSDQNKESHFKELHDLFISIKKSDLKSFLLGDLQNHFHILNYIFKGLEYLDNSTLNIIPFEIISCLKHALNDWVKKDNIILVTSLSNKVEGFYFEVAFSEEYFIQINNYIGALYNISITHRLIRICLPKVLSRDYLSSVVLYHELGHFIDSELNISKRLLANEHSVSLENASNIEQKFYHHTAEYFADLFAAQYVNDSLSIYLNHISNGSVDSLTHPNTNKRIEVVSDFLLSKPNDEITNINNALMISGNEIFKKRHQTIDSTKSDFKNLIPQSFKSKEELHSVFKLGWDCWNNSDTNFLKEFKLRQKYQIINNLIEKSISNFEVVQKWNENK